MKLKRNCLKYCIQLIATLGAFALMTLDGIILGWASPNIVKLTANDSAIPLNDYQVSWIVSLIPLGGVVGAIAGSGCVEIIGSRRAILVNFVFMSISWTCIIIANSVIWLYIGRAFAGISASAAYCCFAIYLGEIVNPKIRGALVSIAAGGNPFGIIVGTIVETYLPMKVSSGIYLTFSVLGLTLLLWLQDSPYYLVRKEKYEQAKRSIKFYHPYADIENEFKEVKCFVEANSGQSFRDKLHDMKKPAIKKSLILVTILFLLTQLTGNVIITSYMEVILRDSKSNLIDSKQFVIYANILRPLGNLTTFKLSDILGRRILLIISSMGTAMAMMGLGMHFLLLKNGVDPESLQWIPIVSILGFLLSYGVGYSPIPSAVLSELSTDSFKSVAALISVLISSCFLFVVVKAYQPLVALLGETYVFWMHSIFILMMIPFALFFLPETKGKTFQEIQDILLKK